MKYTKIFRKCQLTLEEQEMFVKAMGDESDWPSLTDSAKVNWAIDCYVAKTEKEPYPVYDEKVYLEEILASKDI